jgi:putative CocE/NonD family hydrolase
VFRSIYGKALGFGDHAWGSPLPYIKAGYVYVSQDCRGCHGSEGDFDFFFQEQEDGYDSIEWLARQPWSNGRVGVIGASGVAMTAFQAVASQPPSLVTAFMEIGAADMETWVKRGGALSELYFLSDYIYFTTLLDSIPRLQVDDSERERLMAGIAEVATLTQEDLKKLPVLDYEVLKDSRLNGGIWNIFMTEPTDPYWKRDASSPGKDPSRVGVPVKAIAGFYDPFAISMARALSNPDLGHELIIGPWTHSGAYGFTNGIRLHQDAPGGEAVWGPAALAWFDQWMKGDASPPQPGSSKVNYFLSGENRWIESPTWPPVAATREMFLTSAGDAASAPGGGALVFERPSQSGDRHYSYDPVDPVPTIGGTMIEFASRLARYDAAMPADGVHDQRRLESRPDVLVYTSPVLDDVVRIAGTFKVNLWVSSSAPDTDFFVRLIDVEPDGFAANVAEAMIRARYRNGANDSWLTPGEPLELVMESEPIAHSFLPGHRVRVHIASSSFPKFSRNLNSTAVPEFGTEADITVAHQTVLDGPNTPSRVTLPIVPLSENAPPYGQLPSSEEGDAPAAMAGGVLPPGRR